MAKVKQWLNTNLTILVIILFTILVVLSLSSVVAARKASEAVKNTDLIAECTTPGTRCAKLSAENETRRLARAAAENKCIIETILDFPPSEQREGLKEQILTGYDECVERLSENPDSNPE